MAKLLLSPEQRFTCAGCGRCCHRTTVPITKDEAEAYLKSGAELWRDDAGNASANPFEEIPGHPLFRIRKRSDGACGFLTAEGRCRIHEVMGEGRKPLACRVFPFSFHTIQGAGVPGRDNRGAGAPGRDSDEIIVSTSFACPTVIANEGAAVTGQRGALGQLQAAWARRFPETASPVEFVRGRAISREALARIRAFLSLVIDRSEDVRDNMRRIAALLEDWSRPRVLKLEPEALVEYLELTGNYALSAQTPVSTRRASGVARLLFRGFLFAVLALQIRLDAAARRGRTAVALSQLLAHLHGAGPGVAGYDLRRAMRLSLAVDDPSVRAIVQRYLQAAFETLGSTRRPIVDEIAMRVAYLNAACVIGAMHAAAKGQSSVDAESLTQGLLAAGDLSHADAGGRLSALLTTFAAGTEALYLFPPM